MLTFDQIITLSDKGFSPEQIVKLTGEEIPEPAQGLEPEPAPDPEPEPAPDPGPEPESKPEPDNPMSVLQEAIKGFSAEVAEMKKALQASNIRNITREDIPPSKSADDVLAEIIHPTINKGGK